MLFVTSYITPFILNLTSVIMIYVGILFLSGQLFPTVLADVYNHVNYIARNIIVTIFLIVPSNVIIGYIYKTYPASIAGVTNIIAVVLILTIIAILIDNIKISTTIIVALIIAIISCSFLLYNLSK